MSAVCVPCFRSCALDCLGNGSQVFLFVQLPRDSPTQLGLGTADLNGTCPFNAHGSGPGWAAGRNRSLALPLSDSRARGHWVGRQVERRLACLSLSFPPSSCSLSLNCWTLAADGPNFPEVFERLQ